VKLEEKPNGSGKKTATKKGAIEKMGQPESINQLPTEKKKGKKIEGVTNNGNRRRGYREKAKTHLGGEIGQQRPWVGGGRRWRSILLLTKDMKAKGSQRQYRQRISNW